MTIRLGAVVASLIGEVDRVAVAGFITPTKYTHYIEGIVHEQMSGSQPNAAVRPTQKIMYTFRRKLQRPICLNKKRNYRIIAIINQYCMLRCST